ncbi:serine hydrolase domain-containing protein [Sphingosinicella rhizophila]|nr:serine hydrolase domain-containing protein [Sphingosinicella sp. GR2756]
MNAHRLAVSIRILIVALLAPLLGLAAAEPAMAQSEAASLASTSPTGASPLTAADLSTWLDGYMPYAIEAGDIAGAVVVVVKDGQVLLRRGYGYSDVSRRRPVDPANTLFRTGSISKAFTWISVMQQVERGKIDLDADINAYLDFTVTGLGGAPITMRHLMTHSAGFEEALGDLFSLRTDRIAPDLRSYLVKYLPRRVFAPGTVAAYSNYGTTLAGYIVQRVSGEPYEAYVERHIFQPLGMVHSSFRQPLPSRLRPLMSQGYRLGSGEPRPFEMITAVPAGAHTGSGDDMARLMIALLNDGASSRGRILQPATVRQIYGTPHSLLPAPVDRMLLGLYEENLNGHHVVGHGGDTFLFHSEMMIFPDDGIGLFMAINSSGRDGYSNIQKALLGRFADRYLPGKVPDGNVDAAAAKVHARMMRGTYESSVRYGNFFSLMKLFSQASINVHDDGTISFPAFRNLAEAPKRWREISPFLWREVGGEDFLAAKVEDGEVAMFSASKWTGTMILPVPWWRSSGWLVPGLFLALGALSLTVLAWPIVAIRRRQQAVAAAGTVRQRKALFGVRLGAVAVLLVFGAFFVTMTMMLSDPLSISSDLDWWIWALHILSLIVFPTALLLAIRCAWLNFKEGAPAGMRIWSVILAASSFIMLWIAIAFKLIWFSVVY